VSDFGRTVDSQRGRAAVAPDGTEPGPDARENDRMSDFEVRVMSRSELDLAIGWARDEGWNPGLHDAEPFHAADPEGFLVGLLDGRPVGSISVVRYGAAFGFLGFYIVIPAARGRGHGYRLWQAGMVRLGGRLVGLDGVPAQQENYRRSGFRLAYRNVRYGGAAPEGDAAGLHDARTVPFDQLLALDARLFPAPRARFLAAWIDLPESRALVAVQAGAIAGFGVRRRCATGHKIGPLYADSRAIADRLVLGLSEGIAGEALFLDVPEVNPSAVALAEDLRFAPAFETARMYTGTPPELDLARLYGVTTFELG
jgi:ribosomal protein S18 acetylase RimI-like enzyme